MFGYVTANIDALNEDEMKTYRGLYCGLCRSLKERHSNISRIMLTYDMTFLILVLSSLYDCADKIGDERCFIHPVKKHCFIENEITSYAADMSVALVYNKFIDDWNDDKKVSSKICSAITRKDYQNVRQKYPRQCNAIEKCLLNLSDVERRGITVPDIPANIFGVLLAEIFVYKEDEFAPALRMAASALGRFIYIMDAWDDLCDDIKKEHYNPLTSISSESIRPILTMILSECAESLFSLPLEKNINIMKNVIYSGVWMRYSVKESRNEKRNSKACNREETK
ncbi:hypothetical protein SDC9_80049 [bioreactor metagenome]|uniref:Uncharacterized protein n=1 Tax=bioreactor metagenome TaxID=1076179 RepID=A0A644Z412_9ZZZZ|nr:DUF5685 family protein [Candidatus Metalachnospira sp.]